MSLANYSALQGALAEWLYRTGDAALADRAPDFISLFEADFLIDPDMRTAEMELKVTPTISAATIDLPADYLDMIRLKVTGNPTGLPDQRLDFVTAARAADLDESSQAPIGGLAVARWFTVLAGQIVITPQKWAPIGATAELLYYGFTPLSEGAPTNWLLQKYPNLYLYGSLMQVAAYVDDNEAVAKWKAGKDEAMRKLATTERKRKLGGSPMAMTASAGFRR